MLAVISVDRFNDATVIALFDDRLRDTAIQLAKDRNQKWTDQHSYVQSEIDTIGIIDYDARLLREINHLRHLEMNGVHSEQITHGLELLRFIRNDTRQIDNETGRKEEDEWMRNHPITVRSHFDKGDMMSHGKPNCFPKRITTCITNTRT